MSRRRLLGGMGTVAAGTAVALVVALLTGFLSIAATHGPSMLPRFHPGDLAVLWASGGYRLGQVVAYQSPLLHTTVLHRIVAYHGGLYTFKGDNNAFVDPVRLPASAIKGTLLLHVPGAGAWLIWLKAPVHLALVLAGLVLLLGMEAPAVRWRAGVRARRVPVPKVRTTAVARPKGSDLALPLALALAFAAIAGVAWSRPAERRATAPVGYREAMSFNYGAAVAPSLVYPGGVVRTGQPIFLDLVGSVDVIAHFNFTTPARHTPMTGSMTGTVRLVYGTGWSSVIGRLPVVPLRASQATTSFPVNLVRVAQVLSAANRATGVQAAMPMLVVTPVVTFRGLVSGQAVSATYAPSLSFDVSTLQLSLVGASTTGNSVTAPELRQSQPGSVSRHVLRPATLTIMGRSARTGTVRAVGAVGLAASLALALAVIAWARRRSHQDEARQIEARYGPELIGVHSSPEDDKRGLVDVIGISALAKVANAYGSLILDHCQDGAHTYYVDAGTVLYRYQPGLAAAHPAGYAPGHHRDTAEPATHRLSGRAARPPFRALSPSPWNFRGRSPEHRTRP